MLLEAGDRVTGPLREIAGGSTKAAQALKLTRDRLKEIGQAQGDIDGFRALKAGLHDTNAALAASKGRVADLRAEIAGTDKPTQAMTRALAKAEREVTTLEATERRQAQALTELGLKLHTAGVDTEDLARHQRRLRTEAVQTNREIAEQERRVASLPIASAAWRRAAPASPRSREWRPVLPPAVPPPSGPAWRWPRR